MCCYRCEQEEMPTPTPAEAGLVGAVLGAGAILTALLFSLGAALVLTALLLSLVAGLAVAGRAEVLAALLEGDFDLTGTLEFFDFTPFGASV
jgi:hypothetical protein